MLRNGVWAAFSGSAACTLVHPCVSQRRRGDGSLPASAESPRGTPQLEAGSAVAQALACISQETRGAPNSPKTPVLHNCTASNKPEWSPAKGEPARPREVQMLLPSIVLGPAQRGAGVPEAAWEQCASLPLVYAGWQPAQPSLRSWLLGGRQTHRCVHLPAWELLPWSKWQSQTCPWPSLLAGWVRELRDGPGRSWCACDCGGGAFCSGGLSLPSSRGAWNVLLGTGLLPARLLRWGTTLVGRRLLVSLASSRGCWLPVPNEPLLAGIFPG